MENNLSNGCSREGANIRAGRGRRSTDKPSLTTGQVAKICDVAPRTVGKWTDSGNLPCVRIPGSTDRRIYRRDLVTFMRQNGFPEHRIRMVSNCSLLVSPAVTLPPYCEDVIQYGSTHYLGEIVGHVWLKALLDMSSGSEHECNFLLSCLRRGNVPIVVLGTEDKCLRENYNYLPNDVLFMPRTQEMEAVQWLLEI